MRPCRRLVRVLPAVLAGLLLATLAAPPRAAAGALADQLAADLRRVLAAVRDERLKADPEARQHVLRRLTGELFDLREMAARALGPHWTERTEAERTRFVGLLAPLVESHLLLLDGMAGTTVSFLGEVVQGDRALVHSRVGRQGQETTVDYRVVRRGERWRVYDVMVEGVSMVDNYRAQFQKVISTSSFDELVRKLALLR